MFFSVLTKVALTNLAHHTQRLWSLHRMLGECEIFLCVEHDDSEWHRFTPVLVEHNIGGVGSHSSWTTHRNISGWFACLHAITKGRCGNVKGGLHSLTHDLGAFLEPLGSADQGSAAQ